MKQIAAQAGVSQATVSLSLANHPRIPAETRDRIHALAQKAGYAPNPYVTALMRSRRRGRPLPDRPVLAVVVAYPRSDGWRNSPSRTLRETLAGVLSQAAVRGYDAQETWLHKDGMSNDRFSEVLRARGIQGLVLGPFQGEQAAPRLAWEQFSVVRVGVPLNSLPLRSVCHDNFNAGLTAVQECLRAGYRRPGLLLLRHHNANLQHRWEAGFLAGSADLPASRRVAPGIWMQWPSAEVLKDWIDSKKPDVVITPDHESVARLLAAAGLRVPGDLGLVSLSSPEAGGPISGICQNGRLVGASAADLLIDLVERHERGMPENSTSLMVEGRWNPGQTLRTGG
jgi:DNA-binding LacI/PurR family transcriptional regulator